MSKSTLIRFATCATIAMSLSGCQGIWNTLGFGGPKDDIRRADAAQPLFGAEELEQGRMALKSGHVTRAIQQFRLAAMDENSAADAFNGLGIAYARLGRADLAERYFKMAVSLDSGNPKFAANLDRFYNSALGNSTRALAMREEEAQRNVAQIAAVAEQQGLLEETAPVQERRGAVTLEQAPVRITRTSGHELHIATRDNANAAQGQQVAVAVRSPARTNVVTQASSQPARISFGKPDSRGKIAPESRGQTYPVRIALQPAQSVDE